MPDYWLRFTDRDGKFLRSYKIAAASDQDAMAIAEKEDRSLHREVSDGERLVGKVSAGR